MLFGVPCRERARQYSTCVKNEEPETFMRTKDADTPGSCNGKARGDGGQGQLRGRERLISKRACVTLERQGCEPRGSTYTRIFRQIRTVV